MITNNIRNTLKEITDELCDLLKGIPVRRRERSAELLIVAHDYYLEELTPDQQNLQMKIKRMYEPVFELLKVIFHNAPDNVYNDFIDQDKSFREWLELTLSWSLSPDYESNVKNLKEELNGFEKLIDILESDGNEKVILIPDTNSLLTSCEPNDYKAIAESDKFDFLLLPTVLGELDKLKIEHKNPDVRDKAKKIITRFKGWRKQGSLSDGVTVNKTITVRAEHKEPNMKNTLSWLDKENSDDRIIASVLSVQSESPSAKIILVTGDINLLNKADPAMIETGELE